MKKLLLALAIIFSSVMPVALAATPVLAIDPLEQICEEKPTAAVCQDNATHNSGDPIAGPRGIIATIFTWLLRITGAISVIMIIIGGFRYVISGGDSNGVQGAKNTILYALVGLIVSGIAGLILRFVISRIN